MTDYKFYTDKYLLGKEAVIDATSFQFWERKAADEVRKFTFGNIDESKAITEQVQICVCEVAELMYKANTEDHGSKSSEKVGEWSVSYASNTKDILNADIWTAISTRLWNTGLLYRGCY